MFTKPLNKSTIKKILVFSLSNFGDVVLTCPVIDILKRDFPEAQISVVVSPKAKSLFEGNPHFYRVMIFDKRQPPWVTFSWILNLRKEQFDLVVDLRNTAIPLFLGARYRTPLQKRKVTQAHMKQKHLMHLRSVYSYDKESETRYAIVPSKHDQLLVQEIIKKEIGPQPFVVMAPGSAHHAKRWTEPGFSQVADYLIKMKIKTVFVGDDQDRMIAARISGMMNGPSVNLCGRISLVQLAYLYQYCLMAIVNDSAPMHLASYMNIPVVAIFGPSNPLKYGPWSAQSVYAKNSHICEACQNLKKPLEHTCMKAISGNDVLSLFKIDGLQVILGS